MTEREIALASIAEAAAMCVMRLENVKHCLDYLTPEEAQGWFKARQACDLLYILTNKAD